MTAAGLGQDDEDRMVAAVECIGRGGATELEFGFLEDDVPMDQARWWARARWRGHQVSSDEHRAPWLAMEALMVEVIDRGQCGACGRTVALASTAPAPGARGGTVCRWYREGRHWLRGCDRSWEPIARPNREQRRRRQRVRELGGR